jgi:hypothetical protein
LPRLKLVVRAPPPCLRADVYRSQVRPSFSRTEGSLRATTTASEPSSMLPDTPLWSLLWARVWNMYILLYVLPSSIEGVWPNCVRTRERAGGAVMVSLRTGGGVGGGGAEVEGRGGGGGGGAEAGEGASAGVGVGVTGATGRGSRPRA